MWAGHLTLRVGDVLVGVEYDRAETAASISARCRAWLVDDEPGMRPAFGVRTAKVGFLRRTIGLVHHGAPVRYRARDLAAAVAALGAILDGVARPRADGQLHVPLRVYARDDRAVLVDVVPSAIIDERPLQRRGIHEIPCWRAVVDLDASTVLTERGPLHLNAVIVANPAAGTSPGAARRYLWAKGEGDREQWARWLDGAGDRLVLTTDPAAALTTHLR